MTTPSKKTKSGRRRTWIILFVAILLATGLLGRGMFAKIRAATQMARNRNVAVTVKRDIPYRTVDGETLLLDIHRRADSRSVKPAPALILLHGGSWRSGSKEQLADVAEPLAQNGFVVVSPNYRLAPEHVFPAQIEDARAAVRWMRRHAREEGIDPKRIGAVGFSAGAHLAALLGTSRDGQFRDSDPQDVTAAVRAVISISGPFDFTGFSEAPDNDGLAYWLGGTYRQRPGTYRDASPLKNVTPQSPPMLLITGADDTVVNPDNDDRLAAALRKNNVPVETIRVKNAGHVLVPTDGKSPDPPVPMVLVSVAEFLNRHLR